MNAHKGVSLREHLENITELVITLRKMELKSWASCLQVVCYKVMTKDLCKWWSHLVTICSSYAESDDGIIADIIASLKQFLETCGLGEYEMRLRIVMLLHCHLLHAAKQSKQLEDLVIVTWNIHYFYKQFAPSVHERLNQLTTPVTKELRDLLKIARWNDINFYAIKQSVERMHRLLQKQIKKYEVRNFHSIHRNADFSCSFSDFLWRAIFSTS